MKSIDVEEFYTKVRESKAGQKYFEIINENWILPEDYRRLRPAGTDRKKGYEVHHIQPLSLGGEVRGTNRVYLSIYNHILVHYYLALAFPCEETLYAFWCITGKQLKSLEEPEKEVLYRLEHYADLREAANRVRSEKALGRVHSPESYQKGWETRRKNGTDRGWKQPAGSGQKGVETKRKNGTFHKVNMVLAWETRRKNGNDHVPEEAKRKRLETLKTSEAWKNCHGPEVIAKAQETRRRNGNLHPSEETRRKMSEAKKGKPSYRKGKHIYYDSEGHRYYA